MSYKRILLKLSGEALAGKDGANIDPTILNSIVSEIHEIHQKGIEIAIVIGAGNIFRGSQGEKLGINRVTGDHMGMLATVMNSLALKNELLKYDITAHVLSSIEMEKVAEHYIIRNAQTLLQNKKIVIAAGGTGHPYFTTDTAASLRAIELDVDILLKATRVDGVYTADPEKDSSAEKISEIHFQDVIEKKLRVMDLTAISLCMENNMPIRVFNLFKKGSLKEIISGKNIGTLIS